MRRAKPFTTNSTVTFSCVWNPCSFKIPEWFLFPNVSTKVEGCSNAVGFWIEVSGDFCFYSYFRCLRSFTSLFCVPTSVSIYGEINDVTFSFTHIRASKCSIPSVHLLNDKVAVAFYITSSVSNFVVAHARKISFTTDACSESTVQRVIPDVQFPGQAVYPSSR